MYKYFSLTKGKTLNQKKKQLIGCTTEISKIIKFDDFFF